MGEGDTKGMSEEGTHREPVGQSADQGSLADGQEQSAEKLRQVVVFEDHTDDGESEREEERELRPAVNAVGRRHALSSDGVDPKDADMIADTGLVLVAGHQSIEDRHT